MDFDFDQLNDQNLAKALIFYGDKLLTAKNPAVEQDLALLETLNLTPQQPYTDVPQPDPAEPANA